jgi:hypothetical protein
MNAELIREIADQIVQEHLLLNWKFYAILIALGLIGHVVGDWLSSYVRKRADTFATKADMHELLNQLKATTQTAEEIRTAISHSDWVSREWKQVRRLKLEELLSTAYSLDLWLEQSRAKWVYKESIAYQLDPIDKVKMLGSLYFPELKSEVDSVVYTHRAAMSEILRSARKVQAAGMDLPTRQTALNEFAANWSALYPIARAAVQLLEEKSSMLLQEIVGA